MDYLEELRQEFSEVSDESAEKTRALLLDKAKDFFGKKKEEIQQMHFNGAGGTAVVTRYTALVDALVRAVYSVATERRDTLTPHALVALGGYGRKELCFCSDLDVMLLYEKRLTKELEALNEYVLYFLWDTGFEVGHSVRSIGEALKLALSDDTILTSMLESRMIDGNESTFERFNRRMLAQTRSGGLKSIIRRWERARVRSYREAGDEVYHAEPNVKQTAGGLRDYHTGLWIVLARFGLKSLREFFEAGLLADDQYLKLEQALDFMWRIRNQMYLDNGPPQDVLTLNRQERFAQAFGYHASRGALSVERFMQDYYVHASELHRFFREMLRVGGLSERRRRDENGSRGGKIERGLRIANRKVYLPSRDANWFRQNPTRLLEVIWYSQRQGFTLSGSALFKMKANVALINEQFRESRIAREYFMAILSDSQRVGASVRLMNDVGILDRYLPEFSAVKNAVRYYPFHQHPVNEHTLRALESLGAIQQLSEPGTNALKRIVSEMRAPEMVSLAILLHDLGKVEEGSHIEAGIHIARAVGKRLALDEEQMQTLEFLIRNHLKMVQLSQYRDLEDKEVIKGFATEIGSVEKLDMLYLLTFADLYAVRQSAWSDWISALLYQLYSATWRALVLPPSSWQKHVKYWASPKARAVSEYVRDTSQVKSHLRRMSSRYLASFSPKEIGQHISMVSSLRRHKSALRCVPVPDYSLSQVTVCAHDRPGLLADIVGTFASQRVSVLSADVFTRSDGVAIDSFHVIDGESDRPLATAKWAIVKDNLQKVLRGERNVADLIRCAERNPRAVQSTMSSLRRGVYIDNNVSDTHTVIDVEAPDRIGLLYDITSAFFDLGLDLSVARVATDVRQARDAFYVTDRAGKKITDSSRIQEIRTRMEEVLGMSVK